MIPQAKYEEYVRKSKENGLTIMPYLDFMEVLVEHVLAFHTQKVKDKNMKLRRSQRAMKMCFTNILRASESLDDRTFRDSVVRICLQGMEIGEMNEQT